MEGTLIIRGRQITPNDLTFIQSLIQDHWQRGRKFISRELCHHWQWYQPNGHLKDMACRELLLRLERMGLIQLPPRQNSAYNEKRNRMPSMVKTIETPLEGKLSQFCPPELKMVRHTPLEPLYNSLIQRYHYLGYRQIVGAYLKYMAFLSGQVVACLGWGSPAWRVACRDQFIGWSDPIKEHNLHKIAQNTRFLILPYIKIPHLASKLLSLNIKRIRQDWPKSYGHPLCLLETFVDHRRFKGTSYQAANWIYVGQTKGFTKKGNVSLYHGIIKDVYLYPLVKDFRGALLNR
ncbi:DUF4338 domain-containing protein [Patescibacteria group bacterium]|nr:DUF4338 domain-containing protein [Patescibacteria group bacterium]